MKKSATFPGSGTTITKNPKLMIKNKEQKHTSYIIFLLIYTMMKTIAATMQKTVMLIIIFP